MDDNKLIDQEELFTHFSFDVTEGQKLLRVDKYLVNFIENVTRSKVQNAIKNRNVRVNELVVKSNYKVKPGDKVKVVFDYPQYEFLLKPEPIPIEIAYEDRQVLVVNKSPNMVVHPGYGNYSGTLINAVLYHIDKKGENKLPLNDNQRPGLVHRIDKDTSGLLVIAKTEQAINHLSAQFFDKTTKRNYIALVWGNITENKKTIEGHIGRSLKNRLQMTVFKDGNFGKEAITHIEVLERFNYLTLIKCRLETGRTHQIRAHLKHIGHPLFNDERYGGNKVLKGAVYTKYKQFVENCFKVLPRQALHAESLGFIHPTTKKEMLFKAEIPTDFKNCLKKWRSYYKNKISV